MTDFGDVSENTVVQRTAEIHSFLGRDDMTLVEELVGNESESRSCRAQTELEEVPKSLWFKSVNIEHDPAYFETDLPLPKSPPMAAKQSNSVSAAGSVPIALESSAKNQRLPSPIPAMQAPKLQKVEAPPVQARKLQRVEAPPVQARKLQRVEAPPVQARRVQRVEAPPVQARKVQRVEAPPVQAPFPPRAQSSAIPKVARSLVPRALLWEYLGVVIAAVSSVFVFEFIQNTGAASGVMLFPLFLLSGTATWFMLGLLGRYTWLCPLLSALGLWVLLTFGWQIFAAMHAGYALLVTARSMLPTGGLRQAVSH